MLEFSDITHRYAGSDGPVDALDGVSLRVDRGELVTVRGPSGCGKSTLLMIGGAMLRPTEGAVRIDGSDVYASSIGERAALRAGRIGFVFQMFHLVPYLSVIENVMLGSQTPKATRDRAGKLLESLGLGHRLRHKPAALSAGERQRAAVARALIHEPAVVLADEPTGNLDPDNAAVVFDALARYRDGGGAVLVVTHGPTADDYADRTVRLAAGRLDTSIPSGDVIRA